MIKQGEIIGKTVQTCYNCGKEVASEIEATKNGDNVGATKPYTCPECGGRL